MSGSVITHGRSTGDGLSLERPRTVAVARGRVCVCLGYRKPPKAWRTGARPRRDHAQTRSLLLSLLLFCSLLLPLLPLLVYVSVVLGLLLSLCTFILCRFVPFFMFRSWKKFIITKTFLVKISIWYEKYISHSNINSKAINQAQN